MADLYIGVAAGVNGVRHDMFTVTTGTTNTPAGTSTTDIEVRIASADQASKAVTRLQVVLALHQIISFLESNAVFSTTSEF